MNLDVLTIDFETFYSDDYSLRRMTPVEYVCDSRFEAIGAAARLDKFTLPMGAPPHAEGFDARARWVDGPDLPKLFARVDWKRTALMSHNIGFDGAIMAWRYGIVPALYIDTLGMCRATMPEAKGASLDKALSFIGAPPKGTALAQAKGRGYASVKNDHFFYPQFTAYAARDCDGAVWLFRHLAHRFTGMDGVGTIHRNEEFLLMDMVARMTILPQFSLDTHVLSQHLHKVQTDKAVLLKKLQDACILDPNDGAGAKRDLMSNQRFAEVLERMGVEPPTKISLTTGKETYAFSKTDPEFAALLEDEDPLVQALVTARLGFKSTQEETRTERFLAIAGLNWPNESRATVQPALSHPISAGLATSGPIFPPRMPFPLRYSGAHTHRLSGDWSLNLQNLGRDSKLRAALIAPPGHKIVSADASQIEARIVSWLAGCTTLVNAFAAGEDVYSTFASRVYGYTVDKVNTPIERFVGKTAVLGLGFGMGDTKFVKTCWVQSKRKTKIDSVLGKRVVNTYRSDYHQVPSYWKAQDNVVHMLSTRASGRLGVLIIDGPTQSVILPNGMRLYYTNMRKEFLPLPGEPDRKRAQWVFDYGREKKFTFGGKMTENAVQALARIITMNAATRVRRIVGRREGWAWPLAGQIHDQLAYVVPESIADDFLALVIEEMSRRLDWFASLPLAAEGGIGNNLLEIK
jgi:DNA polymerase